MAKFHQVTDAEEWVYPKLINYRMGCCDCGLVHNVTFQIVRVKDMNAPYDKDEVINDPELRVRMHVERNNRSTAQLRRQDKYRKQKAQLELKEGGDSALVNSESEVHHE